MSGWDGRDARAAPAGVLASANCSKDPALHDHPAHIRNFSIIAHIDHGKSTLADRLIDATGALTAREINEQVLDCMDLERERGITIKASPCACTTRPRRPGLSAQSDRHARPRRFRLRGSRAPAACEGALLVVDASQGVEAQTLANVYQALDAQPRDRAGAEQDRSAGRRAGAGEPADRGLIGLDACEAVLARQDGPGHRRGAGGDRPRVPAAEGRCRRAAEGAAGRQLVRPLPRRRRAGARVRRQRRASTIR